MMNQSAPKFLKILIPVAVILVAVIGGLTLVKSRVASDTATRAGEGGNAELAVGSVLPDFSLDTLEAKKLPVSSLKGKVFLINFWATWCEACMVEMPSIVALRQRYKDKGLEVVAVNVDENPEAVVPKAIRDLKIDFPVYRDSESKLADLFDVRAIPLTVVINHDRRVLLIETGERDWNGSEVHKLLDEWLGS
jgi:thiol-disulfide isomerase/thioredoxin